MDNIINLDNRYLDQTNQKSIMEHQQLVLEKITELEKDMTFHKDKIKHMITMKDETFIKIGKLCYELNVFQEKVAEDQRSNKFFNKVTKEVSIMWSKL